MVVCTSERSVSSIGTSVAGLAVVGEFAGKPELDRERDQMLLRAVVQVALDRSA